MRIYQGTLSKGEFYYNSRQKKRARISRILRVHADEKEDIDSADGRRHRRRHGHRVRHRRHVLRRGRRTVSLESIFAAEPVIDLSISPNKRADYDKLSKALNRFMREDPTFRVHVDHETSETIISGMGELHLEIYVERIRREYKVDCTVGAPKVSYREAPTRETAVQLQAQEADRRLRPVRPRRRQAGPADPEDAPSRSSSRTRSPAAASPPSTSPRSRRASASRCTRARSPATRSSASR